MGEDEPYEVPQRLMSKEDVAQICSILGISTESTNNTDPLPEPRRAGAGRVNLFSSTDRVEFLESEEATIPETHNTLENDTAPASDISGKVARADVENILHNYRLSKYSFLPPFGSLWHNVGNQERCKAGPELADFPGTAASFNLTNESIRRRSAWAWYRTHTLCHRAAENLELYGPKHKDLDLHELDSSSVEEWKNAVSSLQSKADNARIHALKLWPRLLVEDNVSGPSWGEEWTSDDDRYYGELADNYDKVKRYEMSEKYKNKAMEYICEGLSLYLEWKQENPVKAKQYASTPSPGELRTPFFGGAGGAAKLWTEAVKWSQDPEIIPFFSVHFRWWWMRAAMARGHAEWLVMELDDRNPSFPKKFNNELKLLMPAPVGCYTEDCVIMSFLILLHGKGNETWPFFKDDEWQTLYIQSQLASRETSWHRYGERNYNFAPGPPDFVYFEKEKTGWANHMLGMFPCDASVLSIQTGYFERHCRRGIADFMSESASHYERVLAICADDIIIEWQQDRYIDTFVLSEKGDNILADLEADVSALISARQHIKAQEAETLGFETRLRHQLDFHMNRVCMMFRTDEKETEESAKLVYLLRIQKVIGKMLGPWYQLVIFSSAFDGLPFYLLAPMETSSSIPLDEQTAARLKVSATSPHLITYYILGRLFECIEALRSRLISWTRLDEEEWHFITMYRDFLETGDENNLPLVQTGRNLKRELTPFEYRRKYIFRCNGNCGCGYDIAEKRALEIVAARKHNTGEGAQEREAIKRAFRLRDGEMQTNNSLTDSSTFGHLRADMLMSLLSTAEARGQQRDEFRDFLSPGAWQSVNTQGNGKEVALKASNQDPGTHDHSSKVQENRDMEANLPKKKKGIFSKLKAMRKR